MNAGAVSCVARIVKVNQPEQSLRQPDGTFVVVPVPAEARNITYMVQVITPYGYAMIDNVVPNGDRPRSPFYCRPASVDSHWPAFLLGDIYVFCINEREESGPCSGSPLPPVIPPVMLEPNLFPPPDREPFRPGIIPLRPDLPMLGGDP